MVINSSLMITMNKIIAGCEICTLVKCNQTRTLSGNGGECNALKMKIDSNLIDLTSCGTSLFVAHYTNATSSHPLAYLLLPLKLLCLLGC